MGDAIIDSGASEHVVSDLKYLRNIVRASAMKGVLADGLVTIGKSAGQMLVDTGTGKISLIKVYHIPTLNLNLISCSTLDERRITTVIAENHCVFE